ncbi:MAG: hypothetical protein JWO80_5016 [Bryobacterales bacterium]|nr:hypothetical protein [Bryobacterales bacterium]
MTKEQRISNLKSLGYTDREADFLCFAALHSGYFVRRQFLGFTERERGKLDAKLAEKTVKAGHAKALVFRHNRTVYNLCSKPFYEAIGEIDNRNRRTHEIFTIKNRLIGLDFVLKYRDHQFFATESEKIAFFRDALEIGTDHFPTKRYRAKKSPAMTDRYFVDKFPIGLASQPAPNGSGPVVQFCYIDDGLHSTSGFEMYLDQYRRLFARVPVFHLIYIGTFSDHFEGARRMFERIVVNGSKRTPVDPMVNRMLGYFRDRESYERRELATFDQPKLIQFREDRRAFSNTKCESLFQQWKEGGDAAVMRVLCPESLTDSSPKCEFRTLLSAFRYELFGTLTNGNWRGADAL